MSNEEAVYYLELLRINLQANSFFDIALVKAIEALKKQNSVKGSVNMRLIDADALANYANNQIAGITANSIMRFPTVDAKPVKYGRWIPTEYDSYADGAPVWDKWECSECGHEHSGEEDTLTSFCPNCGAEMGGD